MQIRIGRWPRSAIPLRIQQVTTPKQVAVLELRMTNRSNREWTVQKVTEVCIIEQVRMEQHSSCRDNMRRNYALLHFRLGKEAALRCLAGREASGLAGMMGPWLLRRSPPPHYCISTSDISLLFVSPVKNRARSQKNFENAVKAEYDVPIRNDPQLDADHRPRPF
jgi:hypothetical protein